MARHAPSKSPTSLNPMALPIEDAARALSRLGGSSITEAMLRADIESGTPTNTDGTINLVHYAAWLVREMGAGGTRGD